MTVDDSADAATVLSRCDELAALSSLDGGLIKRVYLSPEHAAANSRVAAWMGEAGMRTWHDAAGNQVGRLEGREPGLPALLLGSHIDSVPAAGRYDGILGVLTAIAVVRRIHESGRALPFALEVIAFGDEEGTRFGTALLGSRAVAGTWLDQWWQLSDADGVLLRDAFVEFGLDPGAIGDAARTPEQVIGYLEAHIEQGRRLQDDGRALGIVSSIAGARRFALTITGKAGHAATPYDLRHDALTGASEAITTIEAIAREAGLVATVGHLEVFPDAVNVVPGRVEFSLDLRGAHDDERDAGWLHIEAAITELCRRRRLDLSSVQTHSAPAAWCSDTLRTAIGQGIRSLGDDDPMSLLSIAGHDGMAMAQLTEFGMLFVRCKDGVSHHPDEFVSLPDVALAIDAFEAAVLSLADSE
jgi:allantoate deiminase